MPTRPCVSTRIFWYVMNRSLDWSDQSSLAPERRTTSSHLVESALMVAANSSGVPPAGSSPILANFSLNASDASALLIAALSLSTIGRRMPAGAITPVQVGARYPGTPASAIVGSSGTAGERASPLSPSARTLPSRAEGAIDWRASNMRSSCPAIRSVIAGAHPRYGTCTISVAVMYLNNSPPTWPGEPLLDEAFVSLPGSFLAYSISSFTELIGNFGDTASNRCPRAISAIG